MDSRRDGSHLPIDIRLAECDQGSVDDRTSLNLVFASLILSPANALTAVIVFEAIHLPFGIDLVTRSGSQSAGRSSGRELASAKT
jgi:hypothetical protein